MRGAFLFLFPVCSKDSVIEAFHYGVPLSALTDLVPLPLPFPTRCLNPPGKSLASTKVQFVKGLLSLCASILLNGRIFRRESSPKSPPLLKLGRRERSVSTFSPKPFPEEDLPPHQFEVLLFVLTSVQSFWGALEAFPSLPRVLPTIQSQVLTSPPHVPGLSGCYQFLSSLSCCPLFPSTSCPSKCVVELLFPRICPLLLHRF